MVPNLPVREGEQQHAPITCCIASAAAPAGVVPPGAKLLASIGSQHQMPFRSAGRCHCFQPLQVQVWSIRTQQVLDILQFPSYLV